MNSDIVLINPYFQNPYFSMYFGGPPLGLLYLASCLEERGYKVKIIDAYSLIKTSESVIEELEKINPEIICITSASLQSESTLSLARQIKETLNTKIIVGGVHATLRPEFCHYDFFDYGILGEGELSLPILIDKIHQNKKQKKIIIGRSVKNLDSIPFPAWHLIKMRDYHLDNKRKVYIIGSRGCPFRCIYCSVRGPMRFRSPNKIVEELKILIEKYKVELIRFSDNVFTLNKKWVNSICELIKKEKLDFEWACMTRCDLLNRSILRKMSQVGCSEIGLGIENRSSLRFYLKKDLEERSVRASISACKKEGIKTAGSFILGLPRETLVSIKKTIKYSIKLGLDNISYLPLILYPGTEIFNAALRSGIVDKNVWQKYEMGVGGIPVSIPNGLNLNLLLKIIKNAHREFYFRSDFFTRKINQMKYFKNISDVEVFVKSLKNLLDLIS